MTGIYKITSPSGKVYIGQSRNIEKRFRDHKYNIRKSILVQSFLKYGYLNHVFEVVHELPVDVDKSILSTYEILYISQYRDCGIKVLNVSDGGNIFCEKARLKSRESVLGNTFRRGSRHSEESKKKMSESAKKTQAERGHPSLGRKHSEETKRKIGEKSKGRHGNLGKRWSIERRKEKSAAMMGKKNGLKDI